MKVIEDNCKNPSWKIVCSHCNSVLEYTKEDVTTKESRFFYFHTIKCPCCGEVIDVYNW